MGHNVLYVVLGVDKVMNGVVKSVDKDKIAVIAVLVPLPLFDINFKCGGIVPIVYTVPSYQLSKIHLQQL